MKWLTKALKKIKKAFGKKDAGSSKEKCPLEETALAVIVGRTNDGQAVEGAKIEARGRDKGKSYKETTDDIGLVLFKPVEPDTYTIHAELPEVDADDYEKPQPKQETVSLGSCSTCLIQVSPFAKLKVKVVTGRKTDKEKVLDGIDIYIKHSKSSETANAKTKSGDGWATFNKLTAGEYYVSINDLGPHKKTYELVKYSVSVSHNEGPEKSAPGGKDSSVALLPGDEAELTFEVTPALRLHMALEFKDPEKKQRVFPEGFSVTVKLDSGEEIQAKVDKKGILSKDNNPWVEVNRKAKALTLDFKQSTEQYIGCEKNKAEKQTQEIIPKDKLDEKIKAGHRVFRLPTGNWNLKNSDWEVDNISAYKKDKAKFEDLEDSKTTVGTENKPVKLVLDPHWLFCRFEYFDRYYGHSDHGDKRISTPALMVEGYSKKQNDKASPSSADLTTQSNWTIGNDEMNFVQCLPWIVQRKDDGGELKKPDKDSMLRFITDDDHRFIKSTAKDKREFTKLDNSHAQKHHLPCVDRLAYYDLPKEWRSTCYYCRLSDNAADQDFFEMMADKETKADKPLIFSLDDMVLTDKDLKPIDWHYNKPEDAGNPNDRVAIFSHKFSGPNWTAGKGAPALLEKAERADKVPPKPQTITNRSNPGLSPDGLYLHERAGDRCDYSAVCVPSNYLADYPDWTRLVIAQGNLHDVFDQRSQYSSNTEKNQTVGARAAVRLVESAIDAHKPNTEVNPRPGIKKYPNTSDPFFATQPLYEQKFCHPYTKVGDLESGIGRFDLAMLRCCNVDKNDDDKEEAICLMYMRVSFNFIANPVGLTTEEFSDQLAKNVCDRWNGRDAHGEPTSYLPKDNTKKLKVKVLYFMQNTLENRSHIKYEIRATGDPNARQFVNSAKGLGMLKTNDYEPTGTHGHVDTFTAAHEYGHFGSQPDDYGEKWSHCSYDQLDYTNLVPGIPFLEDQQAMMNSNLKLRGRKFWFAAEWVRKVSGVDLKLKHGNDDKFVLPQHPNAPTKTYAGWPYNVKYGIDVGGRSMFDTYLYRLGDDATANDVYPAAAGCAGNTFDGTLVVAVKTKWKLYTATHAKIQEALRVVAQWVRSQCNNKFYATGKITVDTIEYTFSRCLIQFQLRFIVETFSGTPHWPGFQDDPGVPGPGLKTGAEKYAQHLVNIEAWTGGTHFTVDLKDITVPATPTGWGGAAPNRALTLYNSLTAGGWQNQLRNQIYSKFRCMLGLADNNDALTANDIKPIVEKVLTNVTVAKTNP